MINDKKVDILDDIEKEIRDLLQNYRLEIVSFSNDELIDIALGNFAECLDFDNEERAKRQMRLVCSYLFHYVYSQENKPTKAANEKFTYHTKSLSNKALEFKKLLWEKEDLPNDNKLHVLHDLLDEMIINPYDYAKEPDSIPGYTFKKGYIEDHIIMTLSDRLDQRKHVRRVKRVLSEIDELLEERLKNMVLLQTDELLKNS